MKWSGGVGLRFLSRGLMAACAVLGCLGWFDSAAADGGLYEKMQEVMREQQIRDQQQRDQQQTKPAPPRPNPSPQPRPEPPGYHPPNRPAPPPPPPVHRPEPDHRPPVVHRDPPRRQYYRHDDWRRRRCAEMWGGGPSYYRCLDGRHDYLYPGQRYERDTSVYIETLPPPVVRYQAPDWPASLQADRFPVWFAPRVAGNGIVTVQDPDRNERSFHLAGIRAGNDRDLLDDCIARNLTESSVQVNEAASFSNFRGADAEAVVFAGDTALNIQVLAEGCAEFDDRECRNLGLDICDILLDAETSARRERLGLWR